MSGQLTREEIDLSSKDINRPLQIKSIDIEISNSDKKTKNIYPYQKDKTNQILHG